MMKKSFILLIAAVFSSTIAFSQNKKTDEEAIKHVIQTAYVDGIQNAGEIEAIEKGFHPGFNLLIYKGNMMDKLPIYNWIEYVKIRKAKGENDPEKTTCEFVDIDITGTAAMAKIKLFKGGKHIFTDYLSLYKFSDDGWKIVGKIYYRIPE
ncbi:MAG: nuclear transport factor 2 family protein [Bacteroidales bacterium]|nr:nuclear transport factor 2 family protein [Bacteroidales bacterium]MCF8343901.1 nuclear transport factor 2 family protein [Bacteroidales bacterium]MCF8350888.1 nuclear transport factor 2 family protein [Bacteroidales bacterium]MCF8376910.1 nuclear transport factor 2 family protein [Bacteroidales bacterium]MCF8400821.1 nuclear transport factor 2 family protein [Bacteroidales bacterium]